MARGRRNPVGQGDAASAQAGSNARADEGETTRGAGAPDGAGSAGDTKVSGLTQEAFAPLGVHDVRPAGGAAEVPLAVAALGARESEEGHVGGDAESEDPDTADEVGDEDDGPGATPKNTRIDYMYRDASNYKTSKSVVVAGAPEPELVARLLATLSEGEYFVPHDVGLPDLQDSWGDYYDDDHPWHELVPDDISPSDDPVTQGGSFAELVAAFEAAAAQGWDESFDFEAAALDQRDEKERAAQEAAERERQELEAHKAEVAAPAAPAGISARQALRRRR